MYKLPHAWHPMAQDMAFDTSAEMLHVALEGWGCQCLAGSKAWHSLVMAHCTFLQPLLLTMQVSESELGTW